MRDFFKPWQRKIGVVMLVMACMFAAGWVRSQLVWDHIVVHFRSDEARVDSHCGHLAMDYSWNSPWTRFDFDWSPDKLQLDLIDSDNFTFRPGFAYEAESAWVSAGDTEPKLIQCRSLRMPYWSIVLPLTLLSAYLLLSKPRSAKKPEPSLPTEPDHA